MTSALLASSPFVAFTVEFLFSLGSLGTCTLSLSPLQGRLEPSCSPWAQSTSYTLLVAFSRTAAPSTLVALSLLGAGPVLLL